MNLFGVWYFTPPLDSGWLAWDGQNGRLQVMEFDTLDEAKVVALRESTLDRRSIFVAADKTNGKEAMAKAMLIWKQKRSG